VTRSTDLTGGKVRKKEERGVECGRNYGVYRPRRYFLLISGCLSDMKGTSPHLTRDGFRGRYIQVAAGNVAQDLQEGAWKRLKVKNRNWQDVKVRQ